MSATAAAGGGENTSFSSSSSSSSSCVTAQSHQHEDDEEVSLHPPRDPKLDTKANGYLETAEPFWQVVISFIKAGKQAVAEGNEDPNLTKWSKKCFPGVLDTVVKLQEHVVDTKHFELIFCNLKDIVEVAVHGRPCLDRKKNDDFLSNFRECNELILTVLCAFASLRGGLYFEKDQFKDQYGNAAIQLENELIAVNKLLLDCSPTPLNGNYDNEEDALVPAESSAKNWKEYITSMIALKEEEFVKLRQELIFWSQKLKAAINYIDPWNSQEDKEILQLNGIKLNNINKSNNNNKDPTSIEAIRQDLAAYYNDVEFSMSPSSASRCESESGEQLGEDGETVAGKFEDFFCNLRLKKRQQKEGEQQEKQSVTEGEFVSASHLPARLRSAAHTVLVTGPGGAGKTVALKHICIQQGVEDSVIVFVPLKELRGIPRRIESIEDLFKLCSASVVLSKKRIQAIVEKRIPVIFAFDGFDEVHNAQEEDKNIAHFLSDMIDPKKRKFSLQHGLLPDLVRSCDRVIISSREERIASANCNLDSAEARPLVDELAVQLWTNREVERFCLRFFSNAFKKQHEQQNQKGENEQQELAKAVRTATNDVISSLASPLMDSWRGLPLAVTLLSQLRSSSSSSENSKNVLDNMSPARAYSLVLEMHWRRSRLRVADRLLRCKKQYAQVCRKDHGLELSDGVTPELFELVVNSAAEASFKQLLSTNSNVAEISLSSSSSSSSSSNNKLPLWAALLHETGLIRVENNQSHRKATFSHRSWIEFLCARHAATSTENAIDQIPWDQSKFASVWLLLADFARSGTFEKFSVDRFSSVVMSKYAEKITETVKEREGAKRTQLVHFDVDVKDRKASISLLARITNIIKPVDLFQSSSLLSCSSLSAATASISSSSCGVPEDLQKAPLGQLELACVSFVELPSTSRRKMRQVAQAHYDSLNRNNRGFFSFLATFIPNKTKNVPDLKILFCAPSLNSSPDFVDSDYCQSCNVERWSLSSFLAQVEASLSHVLLLLGFLVSVLVLQWFLGLYSYIFFTCGVVASLLRLVGWFHCDSCYRCFCSACCYGTAQFFESDPRFFATLQAAKSLGKKLWKTLWRRWPVLGTFVVLAGILVKLFVDSSIEYSTLELKDVLLFVIPKIVFLLLLAFIFLICVVYLLPLRPRVCFACHAQYYAAQVVAQRRRHAGPLFIACADEKPVHWFSLQQQSSQCTNETIVASSATLHLRWLAELCAAEGALDCFKFIEEEHPEALFGVFKEKDPWFALIILSPALARALDHLDRPSVSACVECIINKYNVEVQLEDAIRVNSLVGVTRAIEKMEKENFSLDASVEQERWRGAKIMNLFSDAIFKRHFDVVAAMLRCRRDEKDRFLWCHQVIPSQVMHFRFKYLFPQDLQFRVWCEEKKDFETSTPSDLAKLLGIDLSSDVKCQKFIVWLSHAEQHLWIPFFHLFEEVVCSNWGKVFSLTPATSPSQLRVLDLSRNKTFTDEELGALVGKCSKLEDINLSGSDTKFTDVSLRALATCASTLRSLNLACNRSCTDVGLAALVSKCTQLEEINLSGDTKFGDVSLRALAASPSVTQQEPPTLIKIDLSYNFSFTNSAIGYLKEGYGDSWSKVSVAANIFDELHCDEVGDDEGSDWCFNVEESGTTQQEKVNSTSAATAAASG